MKLSMVGYLDEDLEDITELMDARVDLAIKLQHAAVLQCLNNREWWTYTSAMHFKSWMGASANQLAIWEPAGFLSLSLSARACCRRRGQRSAQFRGDRPSRWAPWRAQWAARRHMPRNPRECTPLGTPSSDSRRVCSAITYYGVMNERWVSAISKRISKKMKMISSIL